jgi:hypothetical protein
MSGKATRILLIDPIPGTRSVRKAPAWDGSFIVESASGWPGPERLRANGTQRSCSTRLPQPGSRPRTGLARGAAS